MVTVICAMRRNPSVGERAAQAVDHRIDPARGLVGDAAKRIALLPQGTELGDQSGDLAVARLGRRARPRLQLLKGGLQPLHGSVEARLRLLQPAHSEVLCVTRERSACDSRATIGPRWACVK